MSRDNWDEEEEQSDPYSHVDESDRQALRAEGAAEFGKIIRQAIGDQATAALEEEVAKGANDPLTAIEAKPVEARTRADWGDLFASGRIPWSAVPDPVKAEMDLRT